MSSEALLQGVQVTGSILILTAFIAVQAGRMRPEWRSYLVLNLAGWAVLTMTGVIESQWGFVLLDGVWAIVSLVALVGIGHKASQIQ
jgi:nitrate reductase NapE component